LNTSFDFNIRKGAKIIMSFMRVCDLLCMHVCGHFDEKKFQKILKILKFSKHPSTSVPVSCTSYPSPFKKILFVDLNRSLFSLFSSFFPKKIMVILQCIIKYKRSLYTQNFSERLKNSEIVFLS